ncbi:MULTISPECIES: signal recognition particle protein [unclassified Desulfovibrio]|uniref:signal recognition particle protein n=1 Tax=unclassified Desulfovibrio TaxID=2593640 RepID=UPI0013EE1BF9|nr:MULTISPECIES: signal recognition particle protein [unclassified Desulfovibrio]
MFESLSDRLSGVFRSFGGRQLTEENIQAGLREVRLALLEADVNFRVVKDFVESVREKALGQAVLKGVSPAQQVVKIVHDELVALLGGEAQGLSFEGRKPSVVMLVGLQGSGKTTSAAKIANLLRRGKHKPYLVPADVYRPAAIDQLQVLARELDMPVYPSTQDMDPVDIARDAVAAAREAGADVVLLDTAGRLHVDAPLMDELSAIKEAVKPQEILFVADAMTGQDAVTVAEAFNERLGLTGVVLTKMDGDARGGAALSIRSVTGAPVKFVGVGEKLSEMEVFHPDRIAGRILGMGDVLTLVEKAQDAFDAEEVEAMARKMRKASFDLEDFRTQMRRVKKLGSLESILKMIPGLGGLTDKLAQANGALPEAELARTEAIINSMTPAERRDPDILNGSRRARIAKGSGTSVAQVNQLVRQFTQMRKMMQGIMTGRGQGKGLPRMPRGLPGGMPGGLPGMGGFPGMPPMPGGAPAGHGGKSAAAKKRKKKERQQKRKKK